MLFICISPRSAECCDDIVVAQLFLVAAAQRLSKNVKAVFTSGMGRSRGIVLGPGMSGNSKMPAATRRRPIGGTDLEMSHLPLNIRGNPHEETFTLPAVR